jgi:hypothetical protein
MKFKYIFSIIALAVVLASCKNDNISFSDYDYQTVYFANQFVARTVELGEDKFADNTLDKQHKISIEATMGGAYTNKKKIVIDVKVDDSLCNNLYFDDSHGGSQVLPMPQKYYKLSAPQIVIPSGSPRGGVEIQLTDAFFNDPKALSFNYVIPLVMTSVEGSDSILRGSPMVSNPNRLVDDDWNVKPKDYVFYALKYVNPWSGRYLRRGVDQITKTDGSTSTSLRHVEYVENDELVSASSQGLKVCEIPLTVKDSSGKDVSFNLILTFADDGTCTVKGNADTYDISGTGKFVTNGEKQSIGGSDRDALYLDYNVKFKNIDNNLQYATRDTLVMRDRNVSLDYFTLSMK